MYCLPKHLVNDFLKKLKDGTIHPDKLTDMTSAERRTFFADFLGESNAVEVNALLESKLILKNQQQGIITWAKQVGGMKPEAKRDILSRVNKMTEVLTPENQDAFLEDLAAHKLGVTVTMEEAANISELARLTEEKKTTMESGPRRELLQPATDSEMEYGKARVAFGNYINELKTDALQKTTLEMLASPIELISKGAGIAKSSKATLDDSAVFNQGWKVLMTHPAIWAKNALNSFKDIWNTFGGKNVMDEINADIVSRPNYPNMVKDKLQVGVIEEAFPESKLLEKIPFAGRVHLAAENAFTGFAYRNRADLYDLYTDIARKSGIQETTGIGIGKLCNSLGSRGNLGRLEPVAGVVNNVLFSPRNLKANIDILTVHALDKGISPFVRKQAAINLVKIISGTAAVLAIAKAIDPDSVEWDPRSADFGKIKVGNTRFNISGGLGAIITLAARQISGSTKSSTTGKISDLNSGKFGAPTRWDIVINFFENKLSPAASVVKDLMKGEDFQGNKPTIGGEISNLLVPLPITNYLELKNDPNSANLLLAVIADELGIVVNTYSAYSNLTDVQVQDKIDKATRKSDGLPHKGEEDKVKTLKELQKLRKEKGITK